MTEELQIIQKNTEAMERLRDEIARQNELLERIGNVFVPAKQVTKALGLNKDTIQKNKKIEKFQPIGENTNYIRLGDVAMIQNNKTKAGKRKLRKR